MNDLQWYVCTPQGPYPVARDDERMAGWEGMALVFYADHVAALAACEQRMQAKCNDQIGRAQASEYVIGYKRALDDAIAAVAEVGQFDYPDGEDSDYIVAPRDVGIITAVLAAISDLKAVQHG